MRCWPFWPLAWFFSFGYLSAVVLRNMFYDRGWLSGRELPCRVVSVGNIRVGGTGKTPFTIWLHERLTERGYRVGVVSRGYGGTERGPLLVEAESGSSEPTRVGDEAVLLSKRIGTNVCIGRSRFEAATMLLNSHEVDVVLLEDGFQHRQLKRDVDIAIVDAARSMLSKCFLPAGTLREPWMSLRRADLLLILKGEKVEKERLKGRLQRLFGRTSVFEGQLKPACLVTKGGGGWREVPLPSIGGRKILTVCGVAMPRLFYDFVRDWDGEVVDTMEFPDHHVYSTTDWRAILAASRQVDLILTTEKDFVKLERFPFPLEKLCALRVEVEVERERDLVSEIEERAHLKRALLRGQREVQGNEAVEDLGR